MEFLPTIHECVPAIVNHAPRHGKTKQKDHDHQFAMQLVDLRQWAFERDAALLTIVSIKKR